MLYSVYKMRKITAPLLEITEFFVHKSAVYSINVFNMISTTLTVRRARKTKLHRKMKRSQDDLDENLGKVENRLFTKVRHAVETKVHIPPEVLRGIITPELRALEADLCGHELQSSSADLSSVPTVYVDDSSPKNYAIPRRMIRRRRNLSWLRLRNKRYTVKDALGSFKTL